MENVYKLKDKRDYIIREAKPEDADQLISYINKISSESDNLTFGPGEFGMTVAEEKVYIKNADKSPNQYVVIAEMDGKVIGNLNFASGKRPRVAHNGDFGVSVLKEYWGNGIATNLIMSLVKWAELGETITKINLQVREGNTGAIELYKKIGFVTEGLVTRTFFIDGEYHNSYQMGKIIK